MDLALIVAGSDLVPYLNFRTLAERVAKKAKAPVVEVVGDSPTAATGGVPEPSSPDPSAAPRGGPQRSPQRGPQRKSGFRTFARRARLRDRPCAGILIILSRAEVEPQPQERPETAPEEPRAPPSPPRPSSPVKEGIPPRAGPPPRARTPPGAGSPARAVPPPRQSSPAREPAADDVRQGKLCDLVILDSSLFGYLLELLLLSILLLLDSPPPEQMETEVINIEEEDARGGGGDVPAVEDT